MGIDILGLELGLGFGSPGTRRATGCGVRAPGAWGEDSYWVWMESRGLWRAVW